MSEGLGKVLSEDVEQRKETGEKEVNLTDEQRTSALIALLDDVIKKDEERTQGLT